jgi:hypothetical protein
VLARRFGFFSAVFIFSSPLTQTLRENNKQNKKSYSVRGPHTISLVFDEARVGDVRPGPLADALLAPALLPRGAWNQAALLALRGAALRWPFRSAAQIAAGRAIGVGYQLSYLDADLLVGRAATPGSAGSFVFVREADGGGDGAAAEAAVPAAAAVA